MAYSIGIDLGGRRVKLALVGGDDNIIDRQAHEIMDEDASWAGQIKQLVHQLIEQRGEAPRHIGLAAPGLAAANQRSIAYMPGRMEGLENLNWAELIDCGVEIPVLNDAHAALIGEHWKGAAAGFQYAFLLTLGTGVGGAVLIDGKVVTGPAGRFGHLGHISLDAAGAPDSLMIPGSLEDAIGDKTVSQRSAGRYETTKMLVDDVARKDPEAVKIWMKSVDLLACGIASLINVLDPEAVIIGGGMIQAGGLLFQPLGAFMNKYEWRPGGRRAKVFPATLDDFAGAIGAVRFAML